MPIEPTEKEGGPKKYVAYITGKGEIIYPHIVYNSTHQLSSSHHKNSGVSCSHIKITIDMEVKYQVSRSVCF